MSDISLYRKRVRFACYVRAIVFALIGAVVAQYFWESASYILPWFPHVSMGETSMSDYISMCLGLALGGAYGWTIGLRDRVFAEVAHHVEQISYLTASNQETQNSE